MAPSFILLALAGCGVGGDRYTATQEISKSFSTKETPHIFVDTFNGKIEVIAGPSEHKVEAKVTKRAGGKTQEGAEDNLEDIIVTMSMEGDTIRIKADRVSKMSFRGNRGADVELQVPKGALLNLGTNNGKVAVTGPAGETIAHTSNGEVDVKGAQGKVELRSSNGTLKVDSVKGEMDLNTSNGKIEIASSTGTVHAETSNGAIHFKGKVTDGQHSFRNSNGNIELLLPSDSKFRVDAQTSNGSIETDFSIGNRDENSRRTHLRGTVGENPAADITAHTSNGRVSIKRHD
jgi:DUF4097 and DUF4098 domain-containing protein YvlB